MGWKQRAIEWLTVNLLLRAMSAADRQKISDRLLELQADGPPQPHLLLDLADRLEDKFTNGLCLDVEIEMSDVYGAIIDIHGDRMIDRTFQAAKKKIKAATLLEADRLRDIGIALGEPCRASYHRYLVRDPSAWSMNVEPIGIQTFPGQYRLEVGNCIHCNSTLSRPPLFTR